MKSVTELKHALRNAILDENFGEAYAALKEFQINGGEQQFAYETLGSLRQELPKHDDTILELMDFAGGWCDKRNAIWPHNLSDRVRLVCVESLLELDDCTQVFPIVPAELVSEHRLSWVQKGTTVDLKHKGETKRTSIVRLISEQASFYVTVPKGLDIETGTEVWVEDDWLAKQKAWRENRGLVDKK